MSHYGELQFLASAPPAADSGDYRVTVKQLITSPKDEELPGAELRFHTGERRFFLEPEEVHGVYPPEGVTADYGTTLPHIVLQKKSYPWDRELGGQAARRCAFVTGNKLPWMALLLFDGEEEPELRTLSLGELLAGSGNAFFPLKGGPLQTGERMDDLCNVIEIQPKLFRKIVPREAELSWLAHVRVADLHARQDHLISHPGYFSVVVCSRFPKAETQACRCTAHLVSLEGFSGILPGGREEAWKKAEAIRLVSLYHWTFSSQKSSDEGFRVLGEQLHTGMFRIDAESGDKQRVAQTNPQVHAKERLNKGFMVLHHAVRTGEETASWYRGPLIPQPPEGSRQGESAGADGRILYDRDTTLFDMSYAAAWQMGRIRMLADQAAALELCRWKSAGLYAARRRMEQTILDRHFHALGEAAGDVPGEKNRFFHSLAAALGDLLVGTETEASVFARQEEVNEHRILDEDGAADDVIPEP